MNCRHSEHDLALYIEGDLPRNQAEELDRHLLSCASCREFIDELRESQSVFKSIRQDVVRPAALAEVRTQVFERVAAVRTKRSWGRWVYALAGAAFVVAVMAGVFARVPHPRQEARPVAQEVRAEPVIVQPSVRVVPKVATVRVAHRRTVKKNPPPAPTKEIMVKLLTDDPNVVIYWLIDQKGDSL